MRERPIGGIMDVEATIYCEKESHKGIIIGKKGDMLKKYPPVRGRIWRISSNAA